MDDIEEEPIVDSKAAKRLYFGPGFSMTCAGQFIQTAADGFAEVASPTAEILIHVQPAPITEKIEENDE